MLGQAACIMSTTGSQGINWVIHWDEVCRLVEQLRAIVNGTGTRDPAIIADLTAQYGEKVAQVNQRAEYCYDLFRRGFLAEVIAECELSPPVLEVAAKLNFPERSALDVLCTSLGITPAPSVLSDLCTELGRAYQLYQSTNEMLRTQRLLALANAPLSSRLMVLRQLAAAVSEITSWREDLISWEKKRLEDIERLLRSSTRDFTLEQLMEIKQEIESTPWRAPVPQSLVSRLNSLLAEAARKQALIHLERLAQQIGEAHRERDCSRAQQLLWQYQHYLNYLATDERMAYWARVASSAEWIERTEQQMKKEQARQERLTKLEELLGGEASWQEVNAAYRAFVQLCPEVPQWIARWYAARFQRHRLARWSLIGVAVLGGLVVLLFLWRIRNA